MTHEENMQMQDAVRNGVITYEQYIDWLRQADPDGRGAPSREYFNAPATGSLGDRINNMFGGLGGNGLADFVRMIGAVYGQNPVAYQPENPPVQQPWTYKANPYTDEQIQNMYKNGQFMYSGGYWGTDNDTGQPVWNPPNYNVNIWGSGSPYSDQPHYLGGMNTVVQAMNNINNGYDIPSGYYQSVIDRYKADPSLLTSQADQIDRMIEQARHELATGGRTQWANTILDTYLPQQQAYRQMIDQFSNAFQQWQPNPGGGTSWQQTATPWQGAAQYLEQAQNGNQPTAGTAAQTQNQGWTPYTNYPNNWQPNPQYQTQPYPQGGGTSVGYGQPYQQPTKELHQNYQGTQGTVSTNPVTQNYQAPQGTVSTNPVTQNYADMNKNQQMAAKLNPNLARLLSVR